MNRQSKRTFTHGVLRIYSKLKKECPNLLFKDLKEAIKRERDQRSDMVQYLIKKKLYYLCLSKK